MPRTLIPFAILALAIATIALTALWIIDAPLLLVGQNAFGYLRPLEDFQEKPSCGWSRPGGLLRLDPPHDFDSAWELRGSSQAGSEPCIATLQYMRSLRSGPAGEQARGVDSDLVQSVQNSSVLPSELVGGTREETFPAEKLVGKRILIIGDSVDRYMTDYLHQTFPGSSLVIQGLVPPYVLGSHDEQPGSYPRTLTIPIPLAHLPPAWNIASNPAPNVTIDFVHFYGADEIDIFGDKGSKTAKNGPPTMTPRLEALVGLWGSNEYDLVQIGNGFWDLARYQRMRYMDHGVDDLVGLPTDWLDAWTVESRKLMDLVRDAWPGAKIAWRIIHDPKLAAGGWFLPQGSPSLPKTVRPFTLIRVHQLRQAQIRMVEEEGIGMIPLGVTMLAQQENHWLRDDIHPGPLGNAIHAEMLMEMAVSAGG